MPSAEIRYHLGLDYQAGSDTLPSSASRPQGYLRVAPERRELGIYIGSEGSGELGAVQIQKPILHRLDRRHRRTRRRILNQRLH